MSPVAPIAHLIGIALAVFGGFWVGGVVTPDLPSAETEPGVVAAEGEDVTGAAAESLYHPAPLDAAVKQTIEQLGAGAEVSSVEITPATLNAAQAAGAETAPLESMPLDAPERIVAGVQEARERMGVKGAVGLDDVKAFRWTPGNPDASEWYVLLDVSTVGVPTEFSAARNGADVSPGSP
jgi:hypothetical protein